MTAALFTRQPAPARLAIPLHLLPEERSELRALFSRLDRLTVGRLEGAAVESVLVGLARRNGAPFEPTRGAAIWLALFVEARLVTARGTYLRSALFHLQGALKHNLAFRCGVTV